VLARSGARMAGRCGGNVVKLNSRFLVLEF